MQVERKNWTAKDSQKELQKWCDAKTVDTSIIVQTQKALEENVWYFLSTIRERTGRYQKRLQNALAKKPRFDVASDVPLAQEPLNIASKEFEKLLVVHLRLMPEEDDEEEAGEEEEDDAASDDSDTYDAVEKIDVTFPANDALLEEQRLMKTEAYEMETTLDGVCDWLSLSIPDVREDDTDGVDIIQAILAASQAHATAINTIGKVEKTYLEERAEIEIEVKTFPHSASNHQLLITHDLDAWDDVERGWRTMLRSSLILHATLLKNMAVLLEPRKNEGSSGIYY